MDIGRHLRESRERRGMTLHQIADSTKLSTTTLQHIERNEFDRLPGGIFTRGFLRAYAAEVGVNPEEVVSSYLVQFSSAPAATEELPPVRGTENAYAGPLLMAVVAIGLALIVYGSFRDSSESPVSPPLELVQAPTPAASPVTPAASPVTESVPSSALPATERREEGVHLEIQPTGECWVSALADGRVVVQRLLQSGEHVTVIAREEVILRIGDPGAFVYTLNGASGLPLGEAGRPVTVQITRDNYHRFLSAGGAPEARRKRLASVT
jgi:cytoskeleton protein RodZ